MKKMSITVTEASRHYDHECENGERNEYTYRILHRKFAMYGVEAIKTPLPGLRAKLPGRQVKLVT
jgi:hypothetical protein